MANSFLNHIKWVELDCWLCNVYNLWFFNWHILRVKREFGPEQITSPSFVEVALPGRLNASFAILIYSLNMVLKNQMPHDVSGYM